MNKIATLITCLSLFACVGPMGPAGQDGTDGKDGKMGVPGADGVDGSMGTMGLMGKPGTNGTNGINGTQGLQGSPGPMGLPGQSAESLEDAALVLQPYEKSILDIQCTGIDPTNNNVATVFSCTGAKIKAGVLTAAHCFDPTTQLTSCNIFNATVLVGTTPAPVGKQPLVSGFTQDVALLTNVTWNTTGAGLSEIPVDPTWRPTVGETVGLMNFPGDLRNWVEYSFGAIESASVPVSNQYLLGFTVDYVSTHGSSGGPVFDAKGDIVAVHCLGFIHTEDLTLALANRVPTTF